MKSFWRLFLLLAVLASPTALAQSGLKTRNVILITTDGLRWEEIFRGMDPDLVNRQYGNVSDTNALRAQFLRDTPAESRAALFPFLWGTVAKQGQLWGNRDKNSSMRLGNSRHFSYPGYNEFLTGIPDPAIDSNDKNLNVNTNVFEWLHGQPGFKGRVAAAVNWDVLPWILNAPRAGFPVWSAFDVPQGTRRLPVPEALNEMTDYSHTIWSSVLLDTFTGYAARHAVREFKPRALYVSLGETDDWAHDGAYARYLWSAHQFDRFLASLWQLCQSMPEYRDSTTFLISTDHGRGPAPIAWKSHGREIADSAWLWFAVIGPDTAPLGERSDTPLVIQAQIAATVAAFLGKDFNAASPKAAKPLPEVVGR